MNGTVLGFVHLLHLENAFVVIRQLFRLVRQYRQMSKLRHDRSSCDLSIVVSAITA
jgi:hypothetical protein